MRRFTISKSSASSYGGLIEKIEVFRSMLRWAQQLDRPEIQKLLQQSNALRDEIMLMSRRERSVEATEQASSAESKKKLSASERRQALLDRSFVFEGVFGDSPRLLEALEIAEKAAPTDLPVLVDGESGTGKELMAKVIHANGSRADKALVSVNCGAIPENLIESELFGHKKGAFTGASSDRKGKFESADGGTIFLDEVGELPLQGQVKLLRVLQSNEIQRVGSDQLISVDARIVAATNRNLFEMAHQGRFREDLYYRLSVIHVTLPPLRERQDEIRLLIDFFIDEAAEKLNKTPVNMAPRLRRFLNQYAYPGNIRELRNIIFRLSCLADATADIEHLPDGIRPTSSQGPGDDTQGVSLSDIRKAASDKAERDFLANGLSEAGGKVTALAERMDMNRSHLQTLLKKHGLNFKDFRGKPTPK